MNYNRSIKQKSPAWPQEAYRPRRSRSCFPEEGDREGGYPSQACGGGGGEWGTLGPVQGYLPSPLVNKVKTLPSFVRLR